MPPEPSSDRIERRLTTLFPSTALEDHAESLGVVERDGKFQIPAMVWALVFGFAAGEMTGYVRVRFCGSCPEIVGIDSVKYGPF